MQRREKMTGVEKYRFEGHLGRLYRTGSIGGRYFA